MGFRILDLKMPTDFKLGELKRKIAGKLRIREEGMSFTLENQSLDARDKSHVHWNIRVGVSSLEIKGGERVEEKRLSIPYKKGDSQILVVGSGPAGFFAGYILVKAGFRVTLLEKGPDVETRSRDISKFERTGIFNERSNYPFGEGGAGTFSDGKLTSRTKFISLERKFIFDTYIECGAPAEIAYLSHPHLGSDNLKKIIANFRRKFIDYGGVVLFDTNVTDVYIDHAARRVVGVETEKGRMEGDMVIFAIGHSSFDTYRQLIARGIPFSVKPFAVGCRVEQPQEVINCAQWGCPSLPGVKAAEYRLTFQENGLLPVYSFCMCPGGKIVPAAGARNTNIVNGMSYYRRDGMFGNSAIVAGIDLNRLEKRELEPLEGLEWLEKLEQAFYAYPGGYAAPSNRISDFLAGKVSASMKTVKTSYPLGLVEADFRELLPERIVTGIAAGMKQFCSRLKGFEEGIMLGLESKTSSPIQAVRDENGRSAAADNLYICGEGSGWAGGIVSSAADGIKAAMDIISRD